jgi:predicted nucleotidyltransferase
MQIHQQLNPDLWDDDVLKSNVKDQLLLIAKAFYDTLKIKESPEDITITGSSANYNYTPTSDIDLHLLVNFANVTCDEEITRDYLLAKKSLWNDKHDITIFGREVEVYVQDTSEPHVSTGVYSILHNTWVEHPEQIDADAINLDEELYKKKLTEYVDLIEHNLKKNTNHNYLKKFRAKISQMRKDGLAAGGQFSVENLVFKKLRSIGYLDKLAQLETDAYDASMSLESFKHFFRSRA